MMTTFEKGVAKGQRQAAKILLEHRFGVLSETSQKRLDDWPPDKLNDLIIAAMNAPSLKALGLED